MLLAPPRLRRAAGAHRRDGGARSFSHVLNGLVTYNRTCKPPQKLFAFFICLFATP